MTGPAGLSIGLRSRVRRFESCRGHQRFLAPTRALTRCDSLRWCPPLTAVDHSSPKFVGRAWGEIGEIGAADVFSLGVADLMRRDLKRCMDSEISIRVVDAGDISATHRRTSSASTATSRPAATPSSARSSASWAFRFSATSPHRTRSARRRSVTHGPGWRHRSPRWPTAIKSAKSTRHPPAGSSPSPEGRSLPPVPPHLSQVAAGRHHLLDTVRHHTAAQRVRRPVSGGRTSNPGGPGWWMHPQHSLRRRPPRCDRRVP